MYREIEREEGGKYRNWSANARLGGQAPPRVKLVSFRYHREKCFESSVVRAQLRSDLVPPDRSYAKDRFLPYSPREGDVDVSGEK
jgi:hypothetical protein